MPSSAAGIFPTVMGKSRRVVPAAGALAVLLGVIGLAGWALDIPILRAFGTTLPAMRPGTGLCLIVGGLAVGCVNHGQRWSVVVGRWLALVLALLGIEGLLHVLPESASLNLAPQSNLQSGSTAPVDGAALGFLIVAIGLWLRSRWAIPAAVGGIALAATVLVGYLLGAPSPVAFGIGIGISIPGLLGLIALFVGILMVHRRSGWLRWLVAPSQSARSTRLMLAAVIMLPVVFAMLTKAAAEFGYYPRDFQLAFFTLLTAASLATLVLWNARNVDRLQRRRRSAAAAMRVSEQRTRFAMMETGVGVWDYNCDTQAVFLSDEARRLFGFGVTEVVDRESLEKRIDAADLPGARTTLRKLLSRTDFAVGEFEFRVPRPDGSLCWVAARGRVVRRDGRIVRIIGNAVDVTARKADEARLREAHQRLELAIDAADIGMWDWNIRTDEMVWSNHCHLIAGVAPGDFTGTRSAFLALVHPDDRERVAQHDMEAMRGEHPLLIEYRVVRPDGEARWVQNRGGIVIGPNRHGVRLIGTMIDITVRKQAEAEREALLASERAARTEADRVAQVKDDFLAMISHELRTPLNAIMGWVLLLRRPDVETQLLNDGLKVIERNARAQAQLITDLFDINRLMSGKYVLDIEAIDVNEIVRSAVTSILPVASEKGLMLESTLMATPELIEGDARRVQQVVLNLLSNAVKFTSRGGIVRVTTAIVRDAVEISVCDTGEGMPADLVPQLFQKFRQGDTSTSRRHGGLGLGLAITREIVELHGGVVRASSEGPGKGSEFIVRIPLLAAGKVIEDSGISRTDSALLRPDSLKGLRVLAVDDQPDALGFLTRVLEQQGAVVAAMSEADAAIRILREPGENFDVLISDIGMPGINGYDFIHTVRHSLHIDEDCLPAIAVTAFARDEDQRRSLAWGYQLHIAKPVHVVTLVSAVRELASARHV